MRKLLMIIVAMNLTVACEIFDKEEETTASNGTSSGGESLTCEQFNESINTDTATAYGVDVSCANQILSAEGSGLEASFSSSCLGITVGLEASDIDFKIDFSDISITLDSDGNLDEMSGDLGFNYDIKVGEITGVPGITDIECIIDIEMDSETQEPTIGDFQDFSCTYTIDGSEESISSSDILEFGQFLEAEVDCEGSKEMSDLTNNEKANLAFTKMIEMVDELMDEESDD